MEPGDLDRGLALEVEAASSGELKQSVVLLMRPDRLPRATVTDERGVIHSRVISYVDLLATLDASTVIDQLEREPTRRLSRPARCSSISSSARPVLPTSSPASSRAASTSSPLRGVGPRRSRRTAWHFRRWCTAPSTTKIGGA